MAGLLDQYGMQNQNEQPGLLGGFGNMLGNNQNALIAAGAGLLGGQGLGGGLQGFLQGRQMDVKQRQTDMSQRAIMQSVISSGGSPAQAIAAASNPDIAKLFFANRAFPEYKAQETRGVVSSFNPGTGQFSPQFAVPETKTVPQGESLVQVTPSVARMGGLPSGVPAGVPPSGVMGPAAPQGAPAAAPMGPSPQVQTLMQGGPKQDDVSGLRKEATALPSIKRYQEAAPIFNSMVQSFGSNSRASDLDFVYGMAKIFDPDSVVREGEMVIVNNAQSLPANVVSAINRLNAGQGLQPETRHDLLGVAKTRMDAYAGQATADAQRYQGIATRNRMNPSDVVPGMTPLSNLPARPAAATTAPAIAPQEGMTATNPQTGQRLIFRGGQWMPQ